MNKGEKGVKEGGGRVIHTKEGGKDTVGFNFKWPCFVKTFFGI